MDPNPTIKLLQSEEKDKAGREVPVDVSEVKFKPAADDGQDSLHLSIYFPGTDPSIEAARGERHSSVQPLVYSKV